MLIDPEELTLAEIIDEIIGIHRHIEYDWKDCFGWAPDNSAQLLADSRLDWLTSLATALNLWIDPNVQKEKLDGHLILAWANLGALVEGTMKFLLSIYLCDYERDVKSRNSESIFKSLWDHKKQESKQPDGLMLDVLREFFRQSIWLSDDPNDWNKWVEHIRDRRNSIHAYKNRELGSLEEFEEDIRKYYHFVKNICSHLPEPPHAQYY